MSKVAAYLQEHIEGEVAADTITRTAFSHDQSVLEITPELVIYPRVTNDIRKATRFAWQLAEKGHVLTVTARGFGADETGAAIGSGVVIVLPTHLHKIYELDPKQRLIRLQAGVPSDVLDMMLRGHALTIPALPEVGPSTIGGAVASDTHGLLSASYGSIKSSVQQLEVVLSNGDVIQTGKLSKREVGRKSGESTFEGEIYRQLVHLLDDHQDIIDAKLDSYDGVGYTALRDIRQKDGTMDLTPLFVGSQGTLGIVTELILKAEHVRSHHSAALLGFKSTNEARDAIDVLDKLKPSWLDYYDGAFFEHAVHEGKKYAQLADKKPAAVLIVGFDDHSERAVGDKLKKLAKRIAADHVYESGVGDDADAIMRLRSVTQYYARPSDAQLATPPLFDDVYVPRERLEDFMNAVFALAAKHHVDLPIHGRPLLGTYTTRPQLQFHKVGDKQKVFKLLDEYTDLVVGHGGYIIGRGGEGRVKARFAHKHLDTEVLALFQAVKNIFDPYHLLNPGVKEATELKDLVAHLRPSYDQSRFVDYPTYF